MKVVFAGPSVHGSKCKIDGRIAVVGPARQGDIYRAVMDGANVIGLIDGYFDTVPAVWHKEILLALSEGVQVLGAASMGALRAAECAAYGMVGVGAVFRAYQCGDLTDDDDVAVVHGPAEYGYQPLSVPIVNVTATVDLLERRRELSAETASALRAAAKAVHFKDRSWPAIIATAGFAQREELITSLLKQNTVNQKLLDAELLLEEVAQISDRRLPRPESWSLAYTSMVEHYLVNTRT